MYPNLLNDCNGLMKLALLSTSHEGIETFSKDRYRIKIVPRVTGSSLIPSIHVTLTDPDLKVGVWDLNRTATDIVHHLSLHELKDYEWVDIDIAVSPTKKSLEIGFRNYLIKQDNGEETTTDDGMDPKDILTHITDFISAEYFLTDNNQYLLERIKTFEDLAQFLPLIEDIGAYEGLDTLYLMISLLDPGWKPNGEPSADYAAAQIHVISLD